MSKSTIYVVDTSAVIDLANWFRKKTFPSLWDELRDLAELGVFCCPREVRRELEQKSDELARCLSDNKIVISEELNLELVNETIEINKKYPLLIVGKRRNLPNPSSADPWIISLALKKQGKVVSSEEPISDANEIRTIPDACRKEGIKSLSITDFFEDLGINLLLLIIPEKILYQLAGCRPYASLRAYGRLNSRANKHSRCCS